MKNTNLSLGSLTDAIGPIVRSCKRYIGIIFFILLAGTYGFLVLRINTLSNIEPSQSSNQQPATKQPRIDPTTIQKIQSLQDNSVNVQSLFDSARQNPFQE